MWPIVGAIIGVIVLAFLGALIAWQWWLHFRRRNTQARIDHFARSPELVCRSGSCGLTVVWDVAEVDDLTVELDLIAPSSSHQTLATARAGSRDLNPNDRAFFPQTGRYTFRLTARARGSLDQREAHVDVHGDGLFTIEDSWSVGHVGGHLNDAGTVATTSRVFAGEPYTSPIEELNRQPPRWTTVCPKGVAISAVQYLAGTIGPNGMLPVTVTLRRPGGQVLSTAELQAGEQIALGSEPALVDSGLEILSKVTRSDGGSLAAWQWTLRYTFRCLD